MKFVGLSLKVEKIWFLGRGNAYLFQFFFLTLQTNGSLAGSKADKFEQMKVNLKYLLAWLKRLKEKNIGKIFLWLQHNQTKCLYQDATHCFFEILNLSIQNHQFRFVLSQLSWNILQSFLLWCRVISGDEWVLRTYTKFTLFQLK